MLHAELKVTSGTQTGQVIPLTRKFLIGREQDCQLRPNSDEVSRHHCVITVDEYTVRIRDLGSTNGTFVNGERIRGEVGLKAGDRVLVGQLELEVHVQDQPPDAEAPTDIDRATFETLAESAGLIAEPSAVSDGDTVYALPANRDLLSPDGQVPTEGDTSIVRSATGPEQPMTGSVPVQPAASTPGQAGSTLPPEQVQSQRPDSQLAGQVSSQPAYPPQAYPQSGQPAGGSTPGTATGTPDKSSPQQRPGSSNPPIRLPDPATTGVKDGVSEDGEGKKKPSEKENTAGTAAEIIRRFMQQNRPDQAGPGAPGVKK